MVGLRKRATAVVIKDGKVLLVRDKGKHKFSLPGGEIHKGEPTLSAAIRELYEETGLRATKAIRLRDCDYRGSKNEHRVCLIEADGEIRLKRDEIDRFVWWDMKQPLSVYPHVRYILGRVREKIKSNDFSVIPSKSDNTSLDGN